MVDLITLDVEKIYRVLSSSDIPPPVRDIIIEMHESQRQLQSVVNELMGQQGKMIEALKLVNAGFGQYTTRLQQIEKRYSDPYRDLIKTEEPN